jgi:glycosyltransferase involved in cell wall biosynthesis
MTNPAMQNSSHDYLRLSSSSGHMDRILFISDCRPEPGWGTGERTLSIHKALLKLADVDVLIVPAPNVRISQREGERIIHLLATPDHATRWYWRKRAYLFEDFRPDNRVVRVVQTLHHQHKYSAFFGRYHLPFIGGCVRLGPSFIDVDGVPSDVWSSFIPFFDRVRRLVFNRALSRFKTVFVIKRVDIGKIKHRDIRVLPCISTRPDETGPILNQGMSQRMLFVGGTIWPPNREGIDRFIKKSLPRIREHVPDVVLRVVGQEGKSVAGPAGVSADNFVTDLTPEYTRARVVVCPIRRGAGANVKLAEAAGYGKAIVATPFAASGFEGILEPGRDLLVAESDDDFADRCIELLRDDSLRQRIASSAERIASGILNQSTIDQIIRDAVSPWLTVGGRLVPKP